MSFARARLQACRTEHWSQAVAAPRLSRSGVSVHRSSEKNNSHSHCRSRVVLYRPVLSFRWEQSCPLAGNTAKSRNLLFTFFVVKLIGGSDFRFQGLQITEDDTAAVNLQYAFRLQPGEIARDQLSDSPNLRGEFLIAGGKSDFDSSRRPLSLILCLTQQKRGQPVAHRGEGKFFDDPDQTPQTRTHHFQDFQRNLGMCQAQCLEVLFAYENQGRVIERAGRSRVIPSVEDRQFHHGAARAFNAENLLPAARGGLEDSDLAALNDVQSRARFAFAENGLARSVAAPDRASGKKVQLIFR